MAVTDAGETRILWKRSRWEPMASATAALIGSAWDTATTVSPGCRERRSAMAATIRACMALKDSPPGKRNPLGQRCTVSHSGSFISFFSSAPVHSPKSHSSSPRWISTRRLSAAAIGSAVSRARSSGEAYTAATLRRDSLRARATAAAWARPSSERCRPLALPGRTRPVVGVAPWRTRRTVVGLGVLERVAKVELGRERTVVLLSFKCSSMSMECDSNDRPLSPREFRDTFSEGRLRLVAGVRGFGGHSELRRWRPGGSGELGRRRVELGGFDVQPDGGPALAVYLYVGEGGAAREVHARGGHVAAGDGHRLDRLVERSRADHLDLD